MNCFAFQRQPWLSPYLIQLDSIFNKYLTVNVLQYIKFSFPQLSIELFVKYLIDLVFYSRISFAFGALKCMAFNAFFDLKHAIVRIIVFTTIHTNNWQSLQSVSFNLMLFWIAQTFLKCEYLLELNLLTKTYLSIMIPQVRGYFCQDTIRGSFKLIKIMVHKFNILYPLVHFLPLTQN